MSGEAGTSASKNITKCIKYILNNIVTYSENNRKLIYFQITHMLGNIFPELFCQTYFRAPLLE